MGPLLFLNPLLNDCLQVLLLFGREVVRVLNKMRELLVRQVFESLQFLTSSLVFGLIHVALLVVVFLLVVVLAHFVLLMAAVLLRPLPDGFLCVVLSFLRAQILVGGLVSVLALSVVDLGALGFLLFR